MPYTAPNRPASHALPASVVKGLLLVLSSTAAARINPHLGLEVAPATAAAPAAAVATATKSACTLIFLKEALRCNRCGTRNLHFWQAWSICIESRPVATIRGPMHKQLTATATTSAVAETPTATTIKATATAATPTAAAAAKAPTAAAPAARCAGRCVEVYLQIAACGLGAV